MNQREFFTEVCNRMSWPPTSLSLGVLDRWAEMESPREANGQTRLFNRCWNPLATTWVSADAPRSTENLGYGPGKWNNANPPNGVGIYASAEAGIRATVGTLSQAAYYSRIRLAFREQRYVEGLEQDFQTWIGSPGYSTELAAFFRAVAAEEGTAVTRTEYEDLVLAVFAGSEEVDAEGRLLPREERLRRALYRIEGKAAGNAQSVAERAEAAPAAGPLPDHRHEMSIVISQTGGVTR